MRLSRQPLGAKNNLDMISKVQQPSYKLLKYDRIAGIAFENALHLHLDSITLFKCNSFSTSLALSILSIEEFAKAHLIEDIVWHANIDQMPIDLQWKEIQKMIHSHYIKQRVFANIAYSPVLRNHKIEFWNLVNASRLEEIKQNALYVGIKKSSRKDRKRINDPRNVSKILTKRMITVVNDYLIDLSVGKIKEYYIIDSRCINKLINRVILKRLRNNWVFRGRMGNRAIRYYKK